MLDVPAKGVPWMTTVTDCDVIKAGSKENALLIIPSANILIQHTQVVLRIVLQVKSILEAS